MSLLASKLSYSAHRFITAGSSIPESDLHTRTIIFSKNCNALYVNRFFLPFFVSQCSQRTGPSLLRKWCNLKGHYFFIDILESVTEFHAIPSANIDTSVGGCLGLVRFWLFGNECSRFWRRHLSLHDDSLFRLKKWNA